LNFLISFNLQFNNYIPALGYCTLLILLCIVLLSDLAYSAFDSTTQVLSRLHIQVNNKV